MEEYMKFINSYKQISPLIEKCIEEDMDLWDDEFPSYVLTFAAIGACVFENFSFLPKDKKAEFFRIIEDGMLNESDIVSTATATGLIEAIVNRGGDNEERWEEIKPYFLEKSKEYAEAWMNFDFNNPPA